MSDQEDPFDALIRNYRYLTPDQRNELHRQAIARAKDMRAEAIRGLFRSLWGWLKRRAAVARLQRLDDRMLKDIGLHRSEIETAVRGLDRRRRPVQKPPPVPSFPRSSSVRELPRAC